MTTPLTSAEEQRHLENEHLRHRRQDDENRRHLEQERVRFRLSDARGSEANPHPNLLEMIAHLFQPTLEHRDMPRQPDDLPSMPRSGWSGNTIPRG